jgi:hypothetical protein
MTCRSWYAIALALLLSACATRAFGQSEPDCAAQDAVTRSYLSVRHAPGFHAEPLVLHRTVGDQQLTIIGKRHISNPDSPMYRSVIKARCRPTAADPA